MKGNFTCIILTIIKDSDIINGYFQANALPCFIYIIYVNEISASGISQKLIYGILILTSNIHAVCVTITHLEEM